MCGICILVGRKAGGEKISCTMKFPVIRYWLVEKDSGYYERESCNPIAAGRGMEAIYDE